MEIGVFENKEISPELSFREHENSVDVIAFDPKNENIFMTGSHDETVKIWDLNKKDSISTISNLEAGVWCGRYHREGENIIVGTSNADLILIDPKSSTKEVFNIDGEFGAITWVDYSHDDKYVIVSGSNREIHLYDSRKLTDPIKVQETPRLISKCCKFTPDDRFVSVSLSKGGFCLYNSTTLDEVLNHTFHIPIESSYEMVSKVDKKGVITMWVGDSDDRYRVYTFDGEKDFKEVGTVHCHADAVKCVRLVMDKYLLTGCRDGTAKLWDIDSNEYKATLVGHHDQVVSSAVHPNKPNMILTCSWDLTMNYYDANKALEFE